VPTTILFKTTSLNAIGSFLDTSATATAAPATGVVATTAGGTNIQWTATSGGSVLEWITLRSPVGGWTLSGQITAVINAFESDAAANAAWRIRLYKRTAAGAETELTGSPWDDVAELPTTNTQLSKLFTPTSMSFAEDDRLVIRMFITNTGTMAAGHTATITYNGNADQVANSRIALFETVPWKVEWASGAAAQTMAAFTQSTTAGPIASGAAAQTIDAITQVASGGWLKFGSAAQTIDAITQVAAGLMNITGSASQTIAAVPQVASGLADLNGAAAQTMAAFTVAFTAVARVPRPERVPRPTVFHTAARTLHNDTNLSVLATYRQAARGAPVEMRIIRSLGGDVATPFGRQLRVTEGATIMVLAEDCTPAKGDTWRLDDGVILTAIDADRDAEGAAWTVTVR
jgi:hypothetical protein